MKEKRFSNAGLEVWICFFLLIVTLALFWQVRNYDFVNYDDNTYVTANTVVKQGITKEGLIWAFTTEAASNWHPLTWISHMLDVELYGLNPGAHHTTNLIIHTINVMLLFLLLRNMTGSIWPSFLTALLFAIHPMHVESVAWISERKDVLSTLFFILSIFTYCRYVKKKNFFSYSAVMFFFILGLLSKPMLVTFPFVLMLLDFWPLRRFRFNSKIEDGWNELKITIFKLFVEKIPLLSVAAVFCMVTLNAQSDTIQQLSRLSIDTRVSNALLSYVIYLLKFVFPFRLSVFYPYHSIPPWQAVASFAVLVLITIFLLKKCGERPYLIVGWLWFLGTLVPVIGLVQVGWQSMADRYTYIPYVGIFISVSWFLKDISTTEIKKTFIICFAVVYFLVLAVVAKQQVSHWKNTDTLFSHALECNPYNYVAHNHLGAYLLELGLTNQAINHFKKATMIHPYANAFYNLGLAYDQLGDKRAAMKNYLMALNKQPNYDKALNNLGHIFAQIGNSEKAEKLYRKAIKWNPANYQAHYNLGIILLAENKISEAAFHFKMSLRIKPGFSDAKKNLEYILSKQ